MASHIETTAALVERLGGLVADAPRPDAWPEVAGDVAMIRAESALLRATEVIGALTRSARQPGAQQLRAAEVALHDAADAIQEAREMIGRTRGKAQ
jgi:hypothetical protein